MKSREPVVEPFQSILAATDFSAGAQTSVLRAAHLPLRPGATITLLHVLPDGIPSRARAEVERDVSALLRRAADRTAKAAAAAGYPGVSVEPVVTTGHPYLEIIRVAQVAGAELVVLGRHGRRVRDLFVGSTAERVLRKGRVPVLVVGFSPDRPYTRPLVAVDLQDTSRTTLELGLRAAGPGVTTATVVHACYHPLEGFPIPKKSLRDITPYQRRLVADAQRRLARLLKAADRGVRWNAVVRYGDPSSVIVSEALRRRSDVVVVGTHGRSGLSHVLLGSVAEQIIRKAPCDVVVARPERFTFQLP